MVALDDDAVTAGPDPWADVVGQPEAVARLRAAAASPVHAYLFVGPSGSGRRTAARAFAAELLRAGTTGEAAARHVRLALAEQHPDLTVVERTGAAIPMGDPDHPEPGSARWVVRRAALRPVEGGRRCWCSTSSTSSRSPAPSCSNPSRSHPPARRVRGAGRAAHRRPGDHRQPVRAHRPRAGARRGGGRPPGGRGGGADRAADAAAAAVGDLRRARLLATDDRLACGERAWHAVA
jgi:DNA polymerase III subunit delta'